MIETTQEIFHKVIGKKNITVVVYNEDTICYVKNNKIIAQCEYTEIDGSTMIRFLIKKPEKIIDKIKKLFNF